ncbi:MAG: hypothetical protein ACXAC2_02630 [Candidatus Kariarchaeaceae archaeon]|jgi:hypothetical protein
MQPQHSSPFHIIDELESGKLAFSEIIRDKLLTICDMKDNEMNRMIKTHDRIQLYTGENLYTLLGPRNTLKLDAARLLIQNGTQFNQEDLTSWLDQSCFSNEYCFIGECGHSMIAYLRYLNVIDNQQEIDKIVHCITSQRDGKGRWKKFPFHYTLYALLECTSEQVLSELQYAKSAIQRSLNKRSRVRNKYQDRRIQLMKQVLELIDRHTPRLILF